MVSLEILLAHLVGDYLFQNDWMASYKSTPWPGKEPYPEGVPLVEHEGDFPAIDYKAHREQEAWEEKYRLWRKGNLACYTHCFVYTACVQVFCHVWVTWWALALCLAIHYLFDRFRLARVYMRFAGQTRFMEAMAPWSVIIVDNTFHLLTLYFLHFLCVRL